MRRSRPLEWLIALLVYLKNVRAEAWLVVATIATAAVAVGTAVAGYRGATDQFRNANVLKLQDRWVSPEMQARHSRVIDALLCKYAEARVNSVARARAVDHMVVPTPNYIGLSADLGPYVEFFDEVNTCVDRGLCNKEPACSLFASDATTLGIVYRRTIGRHRQLMDAPEWAREIDDFVQSCKGVAPPTGSTAGRSLGPGSLPATPEAAEARRQEYEDGGPTWEESDAACRRMEPAGGDRTNMAPQRSSDEVAQ